MNVAFPMVTVHRAQMNVAFPMVTVHRAQMHAVFPMVMDQHVQMNVAFPMAMELHVQIYVESRMVTIHVRNAIVNIQMGGRLKMESCVKMESREMLQEFSIARLG